MKIESSTVLRLARYSTLIAASLITLWVLFSQKGPLYWPIGLLPLIGATIAWRYHLVGGILVIVLATPFLIYGVCSTEFVRWFRYLLTFISGLFLVGGVLCLVVWLKGRGAPCD